MAFICKFMLAIGPISSGFDSPKVFVMLRVFHAGEAQFHSGWFIESLATRVLVIFVIRTRLNLLRSRPHPWLAATSLIVGGVAILSPFTPLGAFLGFTLPPPLGSWWCRGPWWPPTSRVWSGSSVDSAAGFPLPLKGPSARLR